MKWAKKRNKSKRAFRTNPQRVKPQNDEARGTKRRRRSAKLILKSWWGFIWQGEEGEFL